MTHLTSSGVSLFHKHFMSEIEKVSLTPSQKQFLGGLMALRIARKAALRFSNSSAVLILLLLVNIPGAV